MNARRTGTPVRENQLEEKVPTRPFEIWFEFTSTYSYLTVMRIEPLLREAGLEPAYRPFLLGPILMSKGITDSVFVLDEAKGHYMWRDVARRAQRHGLAFARPPVFPMNSLRAARIMTAAEGRPWAGEFARAVFESGFAAGEDIGKEDVLARALERAGAAPDFWLARLQDEDVKQALRTRTDEAMSHGIFGAPSFKPGGELFWGDDRLEEAIVWATGGPTGPRAGPGRE